MDKYVQELVQEAPAIDVHSHQGTNEVWQARSAWELLSYHWLAADLRCAGCPPELFTDSNLEDREKFCRAVRYVKATRNTVNYWCFQNIAHDLYGLQDEYLDEANCDWFYDAVAAHTDDPTWESHALDAARVEQASAARETVPRLKDRYFPYEYGEYLLCPGHGTDATACLARIGENLTSASDLAAGIKTQLRALVAKHGIRALHVWIPLNFTYRQAEEGRWRRRSPSCSAARA